jgi:tRNA (cmo5U34)-methyltransferase
MNDELNYPEKMNYFFNQRADVYDTHMQNTIISFNDFYKKISDPIGVRDDNIEILDLGCGTGIELRYLFDKNPKIKITGVDLSEKMLAKLEEKYIDKMNQIHLIKDSYLNYKIKKNHYDYIISVMTLHHLVYEKKLKLYKSILAGLKEDAYYIEADYIVSEREEESFIEKYQEQILMLKKGEIIDDFHIDIPFSIKTQKKTLQEANFRDIEIIFQNEKSTIVKAKK